MTICSAMYAALDKRLAEKKSLDQIGGELCDMVDDPRGKAIRLIKQHKGSEYLIENADWLGYDASHIRNAEGTNESLQCATNIPPEDRLKKFGHLQSMLKSINGLPPEKGVSLYGDLIDDVRRHSYFCAIEPHTEDGYYHIAWIDWGGWGEDGEPENNAAIEFTKRGVRMDMVDMYFEAQRHWTPFLCEWKWDILVVDRSQVNRWAVGV